MSNMAEAQNVEAKVALEVQKLKQSLEKEMSWRVLDDNILGHEAVKMHMMVVLNYNVKEHEPMLLLRMCRTICCKYMRSLSRTYPFMCAEEKLMLSRCFVLRGFYMF